MKEYKIPISQAKTLYEPKEAYSTKLKTTYGKTTTIPYLSERTGNNTTKLNMLEQELYDSCGGGKPDDKRKNNPEILVVIAAGINTNRSDNLFGDFKTELKSRYNVQGMSVRFVEVYPLKEIKDTNIVSQILSVGVNFSKLVDVTGQAVVDTVRQNNKNVVNTIIIGHSGGGAVVGDAIRLADEQGVSIDQAIQIGAPAAGIDPKYVDKVLRIQVSSDVVANHIQSPGGYGPMRVGMPEIREVDINVKGQLFGGHSAYFDSTLKNIKGIDNVITTVDAMWDRIK